MFKAVKLFLLLSIVCTCINAQQSGFTQLAEKIKTNLSALSERYPQEKTFLQTDRNYYTAGETIWMKCWLTADDAPSFLSKTVYVVLANAAGNVVQKKMYKLDSLSSTAADILLDNALPTGNYQISAYTLWMLNFPEFIFKTNVFVYGSDYKTAMNKPVKSPVVSMQFFPEGGDLIQGIESRVAFEVKASNGRSVKANGVIVADNNKEIASFTTEHEGMGSFKFTPEKDRSYTAVITNDKGSKFSFKLPVARSEGIALYVNNTSASRLFVLVKKPEVLPPALNNLLIIAQMNNTIVYAGEVNFAEGATGAAIPKKDLPAGILQITVFDNMGNPLAERIAFINNVKVVAPKVNDLPIASATKNKSSFRLVMPPLKTPNVSIAITDASIDTYSDPVNVLASQLLTSDLQGYIRNPNYYFLAPDSARLRHLDLQMMTKGWRRFLWKELLAGKFPDLKYVVESGISFKGSITKPGSKTPITDGKIDFIIKTDDSTTILSQAIVSKEGFFSVDEIDFNKGASVSYQGTNNKQDKLVMDVKFLDNHLDTLKVTQPPIIDIDTATDQSSFVTSYVRGKISNVDSLVKSSNYLGNVTVTTRRLSVPDSLNVAYTSGVFEIGGRRLDPGKSNLVSIWQFIRTVPGFNVEGDFISPIVSLKRTDGLDLTALTSSSVTASDQPGATDNVENGIAYFLNEVPVSKMVIDNIAVSDVAFVKTYVGPEAVLIGPFDGVIALYTNKGVAVGKNVFDKAFATIKKMGYATPRQFYVPAFNNEQPFGSKEERITLYWNPMVKWNADNSADINFYNNASGKKLKLIVQGIGASGELIYLQKMLEKN